MLLVLLQLPIHAQAFSIVRNLDYGVFFATYRNANTGWRIEGSFSSNIDIEFFICDEGNYTSWVRNENAVLCEHNEETNDYDFNFTIPHDSTWYVVFSNGRADRTVSLEAELNYVDQSGIAQPDVMWTTQSTILTPLFIGFLFAIPVICIIGVWVARGRDLFPAVKYDKILPKSN
jgi:hypothetical protein